jgi:hypothetical protein
MWPKPGGRTMRFAATQLFAVERLAFSWQARFPVLGPIALEVVDGCAHGEGGLDVRALGLPIQRQRGPETSVGEAMRYLAELPWVAHAMADNPELEWRELDDRSVEVATQVGAERTCVTLLFDRAGDVVRASAARRPRKVGKTWVPTGWGGDFGSYAVLGGVRIPTTAEAYWELPEGRYVYWLASVSSLELLDEPFRPR